MGEASNTKIGNRTNPAPQIRKPRYRIGPPGNLDSADRTRRGQHETLENLSDKPATPEHHRFYFLAMETAQGRPTTKQFKLTHYQSLLYFAHVCPM